MCIAILNDSLVRISVKFRPLLFNNGSTESNGLAGGDDVAAVEVENYHPNEDCLDAGHSETRCTLTALANMSSPRSGLGAAVLNGRLVTVGMLPIMFPISYRFCSLFVIAYISSSN